RLYRSFSKGTRMLFFPGDWITSSPWPAVVVIRHASSRQLPVLDFGFAQDGNIWIGVLPELEEVLVGGTRVSGVALECIGAGETEVCERANRKVKHNARMFNDLLEFPN